MPTRLDANKLRDIGLDQSDHDQFLLADSSGSDAVGSDLATDQTTEDIVSLDALMNDGFASDVDSVSDTPVTDSTYDLGLDQSEISSVNDAQNIDIQDGGDAVAETEVDAAPDETGPTVILLDPTYVPIDPPALVVADGRAFYVSTKTSPPIVRELRTVPLDGSMAPYLVDPPYEPLGTPLYVNKLVLATVDSTPYIVFSGALDTPDVEEVFSLPASSFSQPRKKLSLEAQRPSQLVDRFGTFGRNGKIDGTVGELVYFTVDTAKEGVFELQVAPADGGIMAQLVLPPEDAGDTSVADVIDCPYEKGVLYRDDEGNVVLGQTDGTPGVYLPLSHPTFGPMSISRVSWFERLVALDPEPPELVGCDFYLEGAFDLNPDLAGVTADLVNPSWTLIDDYLTRVPEVAIFGQVYVRQSVDTTPTAVYRQEVVVRPWTDSAAPTVVDEISSENPLVAPRDFRVTGESVSSDILALLDHDKDGSVDVVLYTRNGASEWLKSVLWQNPGNVSGPEKIVFSASESGIGYALIVGRFGIGDSFSDIYLVDFVSKVAKNLRVEAGLDTKWAFGSLPFEEIPATIVAPNTGTSSELGDVVFRLLHFADSGGLNVDGGALFLFSAADGKAARLVPPPQTSYLGIFPQYLVPIEGKREILFTMDGLQLLRY